MNSRMLKTVLYVSTALCVGLTMPVMAQTSPAPVKKHARAAGGDTQETVVVTARRVTEKLQDVPISIAVYSQKQLSDRNVTTATDLATYTPDLSANQRFGSEDATFAIRGFTQDLRTEPSVAVYFSDVTMPHGGGQVTAGDGAGPGAFFDLQNVQVLKGPQGTLFGRNTTGGAILLVPTKPGYDYGGYLEASMGNYNMRRLQGAVNIPISDKLRLRVAVDTLKRDGFLNNVSGSGPAHLDDRDYFSGRASLVWDVTPDIENYTIISGTRSRDYGSQAQLEFCNPDFNRLKNPGGIAFNTQCKNQVAAQGTSGYNVETAGIDPLNKISQWQAINTTTWKANDNLTIKNTASYAQLTTDLAADLFGLNMFYTTQPQQGGPSFQKQLPFTGVNQIPGVPTTDQSTYTDEVQFQGRAMDGRLNWQAGGYFERSEPLGPTGTASNYLLGCDDFGKQICYDSLGNQTGAYTGNYQTSSGNVTYSNEGIYAQSDYELSDQLKAEGGFRYSWNSTSGYSDFTTYVFPNFFTPAPGTASNPSGKGSDKTPLQDSGPVFAFCSNQPMISGAYSATATASQPWVGWQPGTLITNAAGKVTGVNHNGTINYDIAHGIHPAAGGCNQRYNEGSQAPTWLLKLMYSPTKNEMLYASYARGYRQGSVNIASPPGFEDFGPETVDTYEIGSKTTLTGRLRGTFNLAAFYNQFTGQQLQLGAALNNNLTLNNPPQSLVGGAPTTAIVNAGTSQIWGIEADSSLQLFKGFRLDTSYAYLNTLLQSEKNIQLPLNYYSIPSVLPGGALTFSPLNRIVLTPTYTLPIDPDHGRVAVSATYALQSGQNVCNPGPVINPPEGYGAGATANVPGSSPFCHIGGYGLLNLNLNWNSIQGMPLDLSLFATNVLAKKYEVFTGGLYSGTSFEAIQLGEPQMYGIRLKYHFGG